MFNGTFRKKMNVIRMNQPWQLGALLLALVVANYLAAVLWPDVVTNPDHGF
jgi:hypothetical protein